VILDGVADEPCEVLGGKTPLEYAKTPNLNFLAKKSKIDYCYTVKEGVAPESSSAIVSLFGQDPRFAPRGVLEAIGAGIKLKNGDLALRANFATVDNLKNRNVIDRRAGRTLSTKEAQILAKAINEQVKLPFKFEFYPTVHHRGVLIFRGNFSDNITNVDKGYGLGKVNESVGSIKLVDSEPMDDSEEAKLSADLVNAFIRHSHEVLENHQINLERKRKGLYPANVILCRDAGSEILKFKKLRGKWMALADMPLEKGIGRLLGMDIYSFSYPKLRGIDVYDCLYVGLKKAIKKSIKMLKRNRDKYDYFYIHFKETDTPGHDNKPFDKVKMIEILDERFFGFLNKFLGNKRAVVTADHTTACRKKAHTDGAVPVIIYPSEREEEKRFSEEQGLKGKKIVGRKILDSTLFSKK